MGFSTPLVLTLCSSKWATRYLNTGFGKIQAMALETGSLQTRANYMNQSGQKGSVSPLVTDDGALLLVNKQGLAKCRPSRTHPGTTALPPCMPHLPAKGDPCFTVQNCNIQTVQILAGLIWKQTHGSLQSNVLKLAGQAHGGLSIGGLLEK